MFVCRVAVAFLVGTMVCLPSRAADGPVVGNAAAEPVYLHTDQSPVKLAGATPTKEEAKRALKAAVQFFRTKVAANGGYLWQYSGDLKFREAEGKVYDTRVWVQPPGSPTIGEAFLDAFEATSDAEYLEAAKEVAAVLLKGQMKTGGWAYSIESDPEKRKLYAYRDTSPRRPDRQHKITTLDDDTTSAAVRFLARFDRASGFKDRTIREAVEYATSRLMTSQFPNGGWFGWWEFEPKPANEDQYPIKKASYPETWARSPAELRENRWNARYILNDDLMSDMIKTWLLLHDVYRDERYLETAKKAGGFLLLAQMPEPQPAWAQHYDANMHPYWGRKFEPPAISGAESQTILETLMTLYRRTGDKKYLEPIPAALAYLKKSVLPSGRLARFYELKTNRPLYFTKDYRLTYSTDDVPDHYGFEWANRLESIEKKYERVKSLPPGELMREDRPAALAPKVAGIIRGLDSRGAWVEKGDLRFHIRDKTPASGVIRCQTFADNVAMLAAYIKE
jgi:hypothetical protein